MDHSDPDQTPTTSERRRRLPPTVATALIVAAQGIGAWVIAAFALAALIVVTAAPDSAFIGHSTPEEAVYSLGIVGVFITVMYGVIGIPVCIGLVAAARSARRKRSERTAG